MDNPYRAPASELPSLPVAAEPAFRADTLGRRLLQLYLRMAGVLQLLYGVLFGWFAFTQTSVAIKGGLTLGKSHVLYGSVMGPIFAMLAVASFFAGVATLRLRRRCGRRQVVYLGTYLAFLVGIAVLEPVRRGEPLDKYALAAFGMMSIPVTLPFLPVVFVRSWPGSSAIGNRQPGLTNLR